MNNAEIKEKIVSALAKSLAISPGEIKGHSKLIEELGMDSLDFLDILFTLERDFGVKIRDADFDRVLRPDKSAAGALGEFLSEAEIEALLHIIPGIREQGGPVPRRNLFSLITVDTLVRIVSRKLECS